MGRNMTTGVIDKSRLIFPGLAGLYETLSPASYSFMRFATGAVLVPHGVQKIMLGSAVNLAPFIDKQLGVPAPLMWAYIAVFAESACAICLAIGLFTRLAALIILIEMIVIIFFFQWQYGYFWTVKGYEYALLWALLCFAILFRGGGRYSIDRLLGKEF
jgi:putative oxidoreductase